MVLIVHLQINVHYVNFWMESMFYVLKLLDGSSTGTWETIIIECNFLKSLFILCWDLFHLRVLGHGRGCVSM